MARRSLAAVLAGALSTEEFGPYQRAGLAVNAEQDALKLMFQQELLLEKRHIWTGEEALRSRYTCAWLAFACQTLANALIAAGNAICGDEPYAARDCVEQARLWYQSVNPWLARAQLAAQNPAFELDIPLPWSLPWIASQEVHSRAFQQGIKAACKSLAVQLDIDMGDFLQRNWRLPREFGSAIKELEEQRTRAQVALDWSERVWNTQPVANREGWQQQMNALSTLMTLSQYFYNPRLMDNRYRIVRPIEAPRENASKLEVFRPAMRVSPPVVHQRPMPTPKLPAFDPTQKEVVAKAKPAIKLPAFNPSQRDVPPKLQPFDPTKREALPPKLPAFDPHGTAKSSSTIPVFDPTSADSAGLPELPQLELPPDIWCLTDPTVRRSDQHDPVRKAQLSSFWQSDPDAVLTQYIGNLIAQAWLREDIVYRDGQSLDQCPWTPSFVVKRALILPGAKLKPGDVAVFRPMDSDGVFIREIKLLNE